jgi:hypothetical protein
LDTTPIAVLQRDFVVNDRIFLSFGDVAVGRDNVEGIGFCGAGTAGQRRFAKCHTIFGVRVYIVVDVDCADDIFGASFNDLFIRCGLSPIMLASRSGRELKAPQFAVKELNRLALLLEFLKFADHNVFADFSCSRGRFLTCGRSRRFLLSETRCGLQGQATG